MGCVEVQTWLRGVASWSFDAQAGVLRVGTPGRPLVVGQAPAQGADDALAFSGKSGTRLRRMLGCVDEAQFRREFDSFNILPRWPGKAGKGDRFPMGPATALARRVRFRTQHVLVLGQAAKVFGLHVPFAWDSVQGSQPDGQDVEYTACAVPHPSGVNRWWNDPTNAQLAARFFADFRASVFQAPDASC